MARIKLDEEERQMSSVPLRGEIVTGRGEQKGVSFSEAEEGEKILLLLRQHWATSVSRVLIVLVLLVAPFFLLPLWPVLGLAAVSAGTRLVAVVFWYLGTASYAFLNFLYWYFNVYIVTNRRIIDVDWYSVVVRRVSSMDLSKVQDVSAIQAGVLSGMFDYGSVLIQTAAEEENFEFVGVPHPQLVARQIDELAQENV